MNRVLDDALRLVETELRFGFECRLNRKDFVVESIGNKISIYYKILESFYFLLSGGLHKN